MSKLKIRASAIKKGDRFINEFWNGVEVVATTDAYRLDGTVDPENYHPKTPKPTEAICYRNSAGEWVQTWWMIEVGVHDPVRIAGGGWSAPEYYYIEVERDD